MLHSYGPHGLWIIWAWSYTSQLEMIARLKTQNMLPPKSTLTCPISGDKLRTSSRDIWSDTHSLLAGVSQHDRPHFHLDTCLCVVCIIGRDRYKNIPLVGSPILNPPSSKPHAPCHPSSNILLSVMQGRQTPSSLPSGACLLTPGHLFPDLLIQCTRLSHRVKITSTWQFVL